MPAWVAGYNASMSTPTHSVASATPKPAGGWDFKTGFLLAFILFAVLNSLPFADAARFRKAIAECEKNLPRDQTCDVKGVVVSPSR